MAICIIGAAPYEIRITGAALASHLVQFKDQHKEPNSFFSPKNNCKAWLYQYRTTKLNQYHEKSIIVAPLLSPKENVYQIGE